MQSDMFRRSYGAVFDGDERWNSLDVPAGDRFAWADDSTYVRQPPYFEGMPREPEPLTDIEGARVLAMLGDSVTTDHISPAGSISRDGPAGEYLQSARRRAAEFNSYGARRGNHEVMMRGTFANIRLRNQLAPGTEGGVTLKDGDELSIYDAAMAYSPRRARRSSSSPARSTARARRATGPRRARAARRARGDRRDLRAHPPLQPRRDGRAAAAVRRRRERRVARARRRRGVLDRRDRRAANAGGRAARR